MKKGNIKKDNKGFTLVETIVSMLILAIIVLPILRTFVVSSVTNNKTKTKQISGEMASTIMESIKALGIKNTSFAVNGFKDFNLVDDAYMTEDTKMYEVSYNELTNIYTKIENTSNLSSKKNIDGSIEFVSNAKGKYYYAIDHVKKDNRKFDIIVEFDASKYQGNNVVGDNAIKQNNYELPKLSELNKDTTAILSPTSYDDRAVEYYYELYKNYEFDKWLKACEIATQNGSELPEYELTKTKEDIRQRISKTHEVNIVNVNDGISISCNIIYDFDNAGAIVCAEQDENEETLTRREYNNVVSQKTYSKLENIYLFFTQYNTSDYKKDVIKINNGTATKSVTDANLFVAVQNVDYITPVNVAVDITQAIDKQISLFSNKQILDSNGRSYSLSEYNKVLYDTEEAKDRIYDVYVYVYEHSVDKRHINLYTTLDSSVGE